VGVSSTADTWNAVSAVFTLEQGPTGLTESEGWGSLAPDGGAALDDSPAAPSETND
jgi:hypothetical protein